MSGDRLIIFDTTLRDGEQSPGASMNGEEKLRIAKLLEKMRVDVIEAGFAISSPGDFEAIHRIAGEITGSRVCSLARAHPADIERAGEALRPAAAARIHTFIATSPLHMKYKLQMTPEQVLETAVASIRLALRYCDDVEFSCEDASRSSPEFLCRIVEAAIAAGASTINLPDTVGYGEPEEFGNLVGDLLNRVSNADKACFSVHCHNDLGLAVANSLAAVRKGARQVECTINGLGERAGNASLEELVMTLRVRKDLFDLEVGVDTRQIVPASRLVSQITGFQVQPNKAIVGSNAFAHEAGIHQDGVIKHRETYEIMHAEDVGWQSNRLVLGKHSGRRAFRMRLSELGIPELDKQTFDAAFERFKALADLKHEIFDEDLQALIGDVGTPDKTPRYSFLGGSCSGRSGTQASAEVEISIDGIKKSGSATGAGVVDAIFHAIEQCVQSGTELLLYSVNAITGGADSQGEVSVRLRRGEYFVNGTGADTDIVIASAKAYLSALNRLEQGADRQHPQRDGI